VTFLPANLPTESTIELVEPVGPRSPVRKFAEAGGGFHHVCYEVDELQGQINQSKLRGPLWYECLCRPRHSVGAELPGS
jgi:methylmalonyl-CoA/ethylmalonyl-CoA epimerase